MKRMIVLSLALLSFSAFAEANQTILLDASCKLTCLTGTKTYTTSQTQVTEAILNDTYVDFVAVSRVELESKKEDRAGLSKVCKEAFNPSARSSGIECLIFKN